MRTHSRALVFKCHKHLMDRRESVMMMSNVEDRLKLVNH